MAASASRKLQSAHRRSRLSGVPIIAEAPNPLALIVGLRAATAKIS
jgi:hypothetical protein